MSPVPTFLCLRSAFHRACSSPRLRINNGGGLFLSLQSDDIGRWRFLPTATVRVYLETPCPTSAFGSVAWPLCATLQATGSIIEGNHAGSKFLKSECVWWRVTTGESLRNRVATLPQAGPHQNLTTDPTGYHIVKIFDTLCS